MMLPHSKLIRTHRKTPPRHPEGSAPIKRGFRLSLTGEEVGLKAWDIRGLVAGARILAVDSRQKFILVYFLTNGVYGGVTSLLRPGFAVALCGAVGMHVRAHHMVEIVADVLWRMAIGRRLRRTQKRSLRKRQKRTAGHSLQRCRADDGGIIGAGVRQRL